MRLLAYPGLWLGLFASWLLLNNSVAPGHLVIGVVAASIGCWAVMALDPPNPRMRRLGTIPVLVWLVVVDIVRSNLAVIGLIVTGRKPRSAFVSVPLTLVDPNGLAILACIVTATPGSAWIQYDSNRSRVIIHVLDVEDEAAWVEALKRSYESRLLEIFQ